MNGRLSAQMQKFCEEYAKGNSMAVSYQRAYPKAKYTTAVGGANKLLKRDDIKAEIKRLSDLARAAEPHSEKIMGIAEMQERLTAIARQAAEEETPIGNKMVSRKAGFKAALKAMELLSRIQGNFAAEKQQIDVTGGVPVVIQDDVGDTHE